MEKQTELEIVSIFRTISLINGDPFLPAACAGEKRSVMVLQEISTDIFADATHAARNLRSVHEVFITAGSLHSVEQFSNALQSHLLVSPDPDMALTNLLRFAEATVSKASLFNDLVHYPIVMEVLMKLFGSSQYFADILVRDPELFRWLTASDSLMRPRTRESMRAEVERTVRMFQRPERKLDALKRLYRREVLRIGARDILGEADLPTVTCELSLLADALIHASCIIAEQQLSEKYPQAPRAAYAVIGLGKLGGNELNYSSDVDIMFVYEKEGECKGAGKRRNTFHEYFNKFAERVIQNLSQSSTEGYLYRVDARLRPESGAGPLARSVESYLLYYESRGELWERQMLIKARPVAGDSAFGNGFLQQLLPFVYPRTFLHHPAEEISRIKARIEATTMGEENIKLRAGGIRDIEFIVQTLQLVNGGKETSIRTVNTMDAITRLREGGYLSKEEASTLTHGYVFFRTLEHRLQTILNTQTHTLPSDKATQERIARRMGLPSAEKLQGMSIAHRTAVKEIFDSVVTTGQSSGAMGIAAVILGGVTGEATVDVLRSYGFEDVQQASKNLKFLLSGSSLTEMRDLHSRVREALRGVAEDVFKELSGTPSPDLTFQNLTSLIAAQKFPEQFYEQLKEPSFRRFALTICSVSPRFVKGLNALPLLLETLAVNPDSAVRSAVSTVPSPAGAVRMKLEGEIRAGIRNILGFTSFDELTRELTELADSIAKGVLAAEFKKQRLKDVPLAVFALGKYGTGEIVFDADLDLIFVCDSQPRVPKERIEKCAAGFVSSLSSFSEHGKLYDVDARLRPEGKNAPLVVDASAFSAYLRSRASLWERQSLTRLRFVCGDVRLGKTIAGDVARYVYETPLPPQWVDTIVSMRRKIETRSRTRARDFLDLKLGPGGMVDSEFLAQMLQLKYGGQHPSIRGKSSVEVLAAAGQLCPALEDTSFLISAYTFMREIVKLMRITLEEPGTVLPEGDRLNRLARCYDRSSGDALKSHVASTAARVRTEFLTASKILRG